MKYLIPLLVTAILAVWNTAVLKTQLLSQFKRLPNWAQPIPPILLALGAVLAAGYHDGLRGQALLDYVTNNGGPDGVMAVGVWHVLKRWIPALKKGQSGALVLLLALGTMLSGCLPQSPAEYASTFTDALCRRRLASDPYVQDVAEAKGIPLAEYVAEYCVATEVILPVVEAVETAVATAKKSALRPMK